MPIVVFFLDALDPRECVDWLAQTKQGRVISGVPRVTPPVIGSFLTGKKPGEHGLVRPTPLYKPFMQRPKGKTIIDVVADRCRLLSYAIPFTLGVDPPNAIVAQSGMAGENEIRHPVLMMPQVEFEPASDDPELPTRMLQSYIDHSRNICATIRQLIRNNRADVYFVAMRDIDSFTHYFYQGDYRKKLIEYIAFELEEFTMMGSDMVLLWFSDHGGCPKIGKFEINRWLIERGYLKITYLHKRHRVLIDEANENGNKPYRDQVGIHTPFIQIEDGSKFYSSDLFDSCVDVRDATEDEIEKLRHELEDTNNFKTVYRKHELFGECDPITPEIIPDRKEGIIVSCNVHPRANEPDAQTVVNFRTGDHAPFGCYGCYNMELAGGDIHPWELYNIVDELTRDIKKPEGKEVVLTPSEEQEIQKMLERKGYA